MAAKRLTLAVEFGRRELIGLAALALVVFRPGALSTEQLTLTTYYPSPYGVYDQLRATNNALLAYTAGAVGVGTTAPTAKFHVVGNSLITGAARFGSDAQFDAKIGINAVATDIYATGMSVSGKNVHVQGNENGTWLRVGDAWGLNGIYSESGDAVVGAATGRVRIGSDDTQYLANSCRNVFYAFGSTTYCPNGGTGWSAVGASGTSGVIDFTIPVTGFMYCCKMQQY